MYCSDSCARAKNRGRNHASFKDGQNAMGYRRLMVRGRRVLEHRFIMEVALGRPLKNDEYIHHKDGNRLNNSLDNLEIMSPSEHSKLHNKMRYG